MIELTIEVEGMKCGMCETHVNDVIRHVSGVKKVKSSHKKKQTIVVVEDGVNHEEIVKAITSQGYSVGKIDAKPYTKRGLFRKE